MNLASQLFGRARRCVFRVSIIATRDATPQFTDCLAASRPAAYTSRCSLLSTE